jgi:hypothetical protein
MPTKSIDVDYDLDDFDLDEIIDHLSWNSEELTKKQVSKIKEIINDSEESITPSNSMINQMKMEVILQHLDKYDYLQICEMFEGKLPYQTPLK